MIEKCAPLLSDDVIKRAEKLGVALLLDGVKKAKIDIPNGPFSRYFQQAIQVLHRKAGDRLVGIPRARDGRKRNRHVMIDGAL